MLASGLRNATRPDSSESSCICTPRWETSWKYVKLLLFRHFYIYLFLEKNLDKEQANLFNDNMPMQLCSATLKAQIQRDSDKRLRGFALESYKSITDSIDSRIIHLNPLHPLSDLHFKQSEFPSRTDPFPHLAYKFTHD